MKISQPFHVFFFQIVDFAVRGEIKGNKLKAVCNSAVVPFSCSSVQHSASSESCCLVRWYYDNLCSLVAAENWEWFKKMIYFRDKLAIKESFWAKR